MQQPSPSSSSSQTPLPQPISQRLLFQVTSLPALQIRRLGPLEREGLSWTTPLGQLKRIVHLFQEIVPHASRPRSRGQDAQRQLDSCSKWEPSQLQAWMASGANPSTTTLTRALKAGASSAALRVLTSDGLIPTETHVRAALDNGDEILKALLEAGARPSVDLLKEAKREEQQGLLVDAGAFERRTNIPSGNRSLQRLASDYTTTRSFFAKPEHALKLIKRMVPKKHKAAMWMLHKALDAPAPDRKLIEYLLQHGATLTPYAMRRACAVGTPELVKLFLVQGGRPDQRLADLMVALWPPQEVLSLCPMIFPVEGDVRITERTLALAVRFSDWKVIHSFVQRGAQSSPSILARAILRLDATPDAIAKLIPKEAPKGFFHQFQRWCVLWAHHPSLLGSFAKVTPDEETLAAAVMRGRSGFVQQLLHQGAPLSEGIKTLALHCRGIEADRVVRLLAQRDTSFAYAKQIVTHGTLQMVRATLQEHNSQQKEALFRTALNRKNNAAKVADLFFEKGATYSKALRYLVCERGSPKTTRALFEGAKVTRHAVERAMRHPRPNPALICKFVCRSSSSVNTRDIPSTAFLGLDYHDPDAVHAFWKLMSNFVSDPPFYSWKPFSVVIDRTLACCEQQPELRLTLENVVLKAHSTIITGIADGPLPCDRSVLYPSTMQSGMWSVPGGPSIRCRSTIPSGDLESIAHAYPNLKGLSLKGCSENVKEGFGNLLVLCHDLEALDLDSCRLGQDSLREVASSCPKLRRLNLNNTDIDLTEEMIGKWPELRWFRAGKYTLTPKSVAKLTQCQHFEYLDLSESCSDELFSAVKAKTFWPQLEEIKLDRCYLKDKDLEVFAYCKQLRRISLNNCQELTEDGIINLAKGCPQLTAIRLSFLKLSLKGLQALATHCPLLEEVTLSEIPVTGGDLIALADKWGHLRVIDLTGTQIDEEGLCAFINKRYRLEVIELDRCSSLTGYAIEAIARHCPQLKRISVRDCPGITDQGLEALGEHCVHLQHVAIRGADGVSDLGVMALARCPKLQTLVLARCKSVTQKSIRALLERCGELRHISIPGTGYTAAGVRLLEQEYPHIHIQRRERRSRAKRNSSVGQ